MNNRQREDLDRHITGDWGEDSVPDDETMTVSDYAREKASQIFAICNGNNTQESIERFIAYTLEESYKKGAADQKQAALLALSNVPRRGSATSVVALITYRDAIKAVQKSRPESDRGETEEEHAGDN